MTGSDKIFLSEANHVEQTSANRRRTMQRRNFWLWLSIVGIACGLFAPGILIASEDFHTSAGASLFHEFHVCTGQQAE